MEYKSKIYCSFGHTGESNWILPLGFEPTHRIEDADVVVFGGGKDVDPGFYGERRGQHTCKPNERDAREREDFLKVQEMRANGKKVKTVGICRGAQLLCVLSGGKLIQDVSNHCGDHSMTTFDRKEMTINSIHHQMVYPYDMNKKDYKILGWSTKKRSSRYLNGFDKEMWLPESFKELEIVKFNNTDSLGFQMHPEMLFNRRGAQSETVQYLQDLFLKFYEDKI